MQTESLDHLSKEELAEIARQAGETEAKEWRRRLIIFAGLISIATCVALGTLTSWHARLITRGETSIEDRINSTESQKYRAQGKFYQNPYDFGPRENWKLFLGIKNRYWKLYLNIKALNVSLNNRIKVIQSMIRSDIKNFIFIKSWIHLQLKFHKTNCDTFVIQMRFLSF